MKRIEGVDLFNFDGETPVSIIEKLIAAGADINIRTNTGSSMMHHAAVCYWQKDDMLKFFYECGLDINEKNNSGNTPLMVAAYVSSCVGVKFLLTYGADVTAKNEDGDTALSIAQHRTISPLYDLGVMKGEARKVMKISRQSF